MSALLDYAWQKPTPGQIAAGGYAGVLRYLSTDSSKNLTASERDGLLAAGLGIGLVWETTATRASQGYAAGQQDVQQAEAQADALGFPAGCPIFYAVDYDAAVTAVLPYFQGVMGLARRPVGVYGSANVIEGVPAPWKWQTTAWSHGRISPQAHLYQTLDASLPGCDLNRVLKPIPLWSHAAGSSGGIVSGGVTIPGAPNFPTAPAPVPAPAPQEDDMPVFMQTTDGTIWALKPGAGPRALTPQEWALMGRVGGSLPGGPYNRAEVDIVNSVIQPNPLDVGAISAVIAAALPHTAAITATDVTAIAKAVVDALSAKLAA